MSSKHTGWASVLFSTIYFPTRQIRAMADAKHVLLRCGEQVY